MILPWIVAGVALVAAVAALLQCRRNRQRLEQLSQMYWELKYQHGEVRSELLRLTGPTPPPARTQDRPTLTDGFVPLTSLKR